MGVLVRLRAGVVRAVKAVRRRGWPLIALGVAALLAGAAPTVAHLSPFRDAARLVAGDTIMVWGPQQFNGSSGQGQTYVEQFTATVTAGRLYTLHLVNGAPNGTQRASKVIVKLNGYEVVAQNEVTQAVATLDRTVALTAVDTIRVTVAGSSNPYVTLSILSTPDSSFNAYGPNQYAVTSGSSTTHNQNFSLPAGAAAPYRVYVTNGASDGTLRATSASVTLNGTQIVSTTELTSSVGALTKTVTLNAANTLGVTVNGAVGRYITVRFTATDTTKPTLTITAPAPNALTNTSNITVSGTISDQTPTTVAVNGVAATVTNNTSYTATVPLASEGSNLLTVVATDATGRHTDSTRTVIRDTQAPSLTVSAPTDGTITKNATIAVTAMASDANGVTVNTNSTPLTAGGGGSFSGSVALAQGSNVLTTTATDGAGNTTSLVRTVTRDTVPPVLTVSAPANGTTTTADSITVSGTVSDLLAVTVAANGVNLPVTSGNFSGKVALAEGPNTISVVATDAATNATAITRSVTREPPPPPPDPATVATPIDPTVATTVGASTAFLYTGANPIQTGVAPGTISPLRAGVIRGKVVDRAGAALSGVSVAVLDHPELGRTLSRTDGRYDLAVNAGSQLTLKFSKTGYLPAQRGVLTDWQRVTEVDSVALVPLDTAVTTINFTQPIEVARGSVVTDGDGTRQATLLFEQGTAATLVRGDGTTAPIPTAHVRATEYTVGPRGDAAMPGTLPPTSAYTYAAELTVDEAMAAGAVEVRFTKPVAFYLDNFLNLPTGTRIPLGRYDALAGRWVPERDGRVVQILGVTNGAADLDVSGSGQVATQSALDSLGISAAERQTLATLYPVGRRIWRTEHSHFSTWDWNFGWGVVSEAFLPAIDFFRNQFRVRACQSREVGSIIGCQSQTLGEGLGVPGTPFSLHYSSDRVPGRTSEYRVYFPPLTTVARSTLATRGYLKRNEVPSHVVRVHYDLQVAGRSFRDLLPTPDPITGGSYFTWDGRDAYGRTVIGRQRALVTVGFEYPSGAYNISSTAGGSSFGAASSTAIAGSVARRSVVLSQSWNTELGAWDGRASGLGGWTLDVHHGYDPLAGVLYQGDGTRRDVQALGRVIQLVPGTQGRFYTVGYEPRYDRAFPEYVAVGADGSVYVGYRDEGVIRRLRPDGQFVVHATVPVFGLAIAPDGSLYATDYNGHRLRRIAPDGTISIVAGTGADASSGDGGPAIAASMRSPGAVAVGPDGSIYVAEISGHRVRRISPDGLIHTFAGTGVSGYSGDGGPATQARIYWPRGIAVAPDGSVYFAAGTDYQFYDIVRRVAIDGTISTVAGRSFFQAGPTPATQQQLFYTQQLALTPDGGLLVVADTRIFRVDVTTGAIDLVAGKGALCSSTPSTGSCLPSDGDGGLATQAYFKQAWGVGVASDGTIYVTDRAAHKLRVIRPALPGSSAQDLVVASEDGAEVYLFDGGGRHKATVHALTGDTLHAFAYNAAGYLASIRDAAGNMTTIERDAASRPTAIVGPYGVRTGLAVDTANFLRSVRDPAGGTVRLYHSAQGLLDSLVTPRQGTYRFAYDGEGRLVRDDDPAGGYKTLSRVATDTNYVVTVRSAARAARRYGVWQDGGGRTRLVTTGPTGLATTVTETPGGTVTTTTPDGVTVTRYTGGDSRFGMQAPVLRSLTVQQPSGLTAVVNEVRRTTRSDSANLFSLTSALDSLTVNGQVTVTAYNAALRTATTTTPEGRQVVTRIDSVGRVLAERVVGLDSVTYEHDARGRVSQVRQGGRLWTYSYDAQGRLLSTLDPLNRRDSLFYDAADRLTRYVLPGGRVMQFAYDSAGNLTSLTPPGRPAHSFRPTAVELDSLYTPPSLGSGSWATEYRYNLDRQLTEIRRPDSVTITVGYDTAGRPSAVTFDRGQVGLGYSTTTGNLTSLTAPGGLNLSFTYDGALPKTVTWAGPVAGSVAVNYNSDFRVTSQTVNGANSVSFGYDRDGLLTAAGALGLKRYAQTGFLERDSVGTVLGVWSYDVKGALAGYTAASGGTTLFQTSYVRDSLSRITQLTETVQGTTAVLAFTYDSAGRLSEVRRDGQLTAIYAYDANGNRLTLTTPNGTVTGSYDDQDRLTSYGAASYGYTRAGALRWKAVGTDTTHYTYDALGNLTAVTLPDGTGITYLIDGQNRRVGKKVNGVLVQGFLYQSQLAPAAELDGTGAVVSRFVYATRVNVPDYLIKAGVTYRLVLDHLGSVRLVVNTTTGAVVQRLDYDEFGRVTQNTNAGFQPFGYAGGLLDDATGLVRFGARDYDAATGRWTAKDPIDFAGGDPNLYAYVNNDPVDDTDVTGTCPWCVAGVVGGLTDLGVQLLLNGGDLGSVNWTDVGASALASAAGVGLAQKLGTISTLYGGAARPTYRFLKVDKVLRVESHPIRRTHPNWLSYPHWHPDWLGKPWTKWHLPVVEPLVALWALLRDRLCR